MSVVNLCSNGAISDVGLRAVRRVLLRHGDRLPKLELLGMCGGATQHESSFLGWMLLQLVCVYTWRVRLWWPKMPVHPQEYWGEGRPHHGSYFHEAPLYFSSIPHLSDLNY